MTDENLYAAPDAEVDVPVEQNLAGRGARLVAVIVDGLILSLVTLPVLFLLGFYDGAMEGVTPGVGATIGGALFGMLVFIAINGYLLAKRGQTVGKALLGVKIVSIETGEPLPLLRVLGLRYLPLWVVSSIPLVGGLAALVDALFIFRSDRRCVHDLIAGTRVMKR